MGFSRQEYWSGVPLPSPLWRPTRPFRTNTQKRCPFHYGSLIGLLKSGVPALAGWVTKISAFEGQQGLHSEKSESSPFLKCSQNFSHELRACVEAVIWKKPESYPLAELGEPTGEAGGNGNSPWGHRCLQKQCSGSHSIKKMVVLASTILESSF